MTLPYRWSVRQCGCGHGLSDATPFARFLIWASVKLGKTLLFRLSQCPSAKRKLAIFLPLCRKLTWLWSPVPSSQRRPSYMIVSEEEFLKDESRVSWPSKAPVAAVIFTFWNGKLTGALVPLEMVLSMLGAYQVSTTAPLFNQAAGPSLIDSRRQQNEPLSFCGVDMSK